MACLTPINVAPKDKQGYRTHGSMTVPCGKCPKCLETRAYAWVFRIQQEYKKHLIGHFLTLTYDQPPLTKKGLMTLHKKHVQLFLKRLRKNTGRKAIKYYAVGEYGSKTWRPHYHAIIFDVTEEEVDKAWVGYYCPQTKAKQGHVWFGTVESASIGYCVKYICKDKKVPLFASDDRQKEFSLMSKNLGKNYLTPQMQRFHRQNMASYITFEGGATQALPRYYRDKIFNDKEKEILNEIAKEKYWLQFEKNVYEAGTVTDYYKNRMEAVRAYKQNFYEKLKRDKL